MANEELIMHAREFTESPNLGKDMARELDTALIYIRELADIAEAAEARAKELEAGEWEYGIAVEGLDGMPEPHPTREAAQHVIDHPDIYRKWTHGNPVIMHRRRKAGPWLPVESEGE